MAGSGMAIASSLKVSIMKRAAPAMCRPSSVDAERAVHRHIVAVGKPSNASSCQGTSRSSSTLNGASAISSVLRHRCGSNLAESTQSWRLDMLDASATIASVTEDPMAAVKRMATRRILSSTFGSLLSDIATRLHETHVKTAPANESALATIMAMDPMKEGRCPLAYASRSTANVKDSPIAIMGSPTWIST